MEQHRRSSQSRPQQRRPAQQQRAGKAVYGAHFAEPKNTQRSPQQRSARPAAPQRERRPAQEHMQRRPAQEHAQRRPVQQHAYAQRRPQQQQQYRRHSQQYGQRPAGYGQRSTAAVRRPQQRRRTSASSLSGSRTMFILILILYIIIGSIVIRICAKKAKSYLSEYEAYRPKYKISEYVSNLGNEFYDNMVRQAVGRMDDLTEYETPNDILKKMTPDDSVAASAEYSFRKTDAFSDSAPSYYILRDGKAVAKVGIERSGWTAKYNFPEWRMGDPVSVMEIDAKPVYSLTVTMPRGSSLAVNGKRVPSDLYEETEPDLVLNKTELLYMKQPLAVKCELTGLYTQPEVMVTDAEGKKLEPERIPDASEADQVYLFTKPDALSPDDAIVQRAEGLTKAYINYVCNKDTDRNNNLAALNNYLMPGSDAAVLMQSLYNEVYWNNPYSIREDKAFKVQHVKMYSDKLCTVEVHFDTVLTKQITNEYEATVRWVMVNNGFNWFATSMRLKD